MTDVALVSRPLRRRPDFLKLWSAQTISVFGDAITLLALPLAAVLTLDASASEMGFLTAAGLLPHLLFSLFAGVWVDRSAQRRRIMIVADLGRGALLVSIPVAAALGLLAMPQLYLVAFAVGALTVFFDVSYSSLFVFVVPRAAVVEANSKLSLSRSASWMGGPALAGGLVQVLTAPFALLADAVSFLVSALFLQSMRVEERPVEQTGDGLGAELREGFRFVLGQPLIRMTLGCVATINFFNFAFNAILILYATRELGISPGVLGAVWGAGAVGAALGAVFAERIERRLGMGPTVLVGAILFPAPLLLVPLADGPQPALAGFLFAAEFLAGFGVMIFDVALNSLQFLLTPQRLRARATGTHRFVNYGVRPIGALVGGVVGGVIGLRPTLWMAAGGALLGVIWLLASPLPQMRERPAELV